MDFPAFIKFANDLLPKGATNFRFYGNREDSPEDDTVFAVGVEWIIGGASGGGYQDDDVAKPFTSSDPEPSMDELDLLLEKLCPTISFLTYKRLMREVLKQGERHESEYYGNYSEYRLKWVHLHDLWSWLVKEKVL